MGWIEFKEGFVKAAVSSDQSCPLMRVFTQRASTVRKKFANEQQRQIHYMVS